MSVRCPDCLQADLDAQGACQKCGWRRSPTDPSRPSVPTMRDAEKAIMEVLETNQFQRAMPATISNARWILYQVLQPHQEEERPQLRSKTEGKGESGTVRWYWVWPYLARIRAESLKFLSLVDDEQRFIIEARADGIFWRGEDPPFFHRVLQETVRMRGIGVEKYRAEARGRLAQMRRSRTG